MSNRVFGYSSHLAISSLLWIRGIVRTNDTRRPTWSASLSRSLFFIVFISCLLLGTCGTASPQQSKSVLSNSSATVEGLQNQRRNAEASREHGEVVRLDLLILSSFFGKLRDREQEKGHTETAEILDRETANAWDVYALQASALAKRFVSAAKDKTLDRQEKALMIQLGDTYNSLGTAFVHLNRFPSALEAYRAATAWWPQTPGLNRNLGLIDAQTNNAEEAVRYLRPIVHASPRDADARIALATSLAALNRQQEVFDTLRPMAAELAKKPPIAYIYSLALMATGDRSGAQVLLAGLASDPMAPDIAFLVGRTLVLLGDDADALQALHTAETSDRVPRLYYFEAMVRLRLKQPSKATLLLEKQLEITPGDIPTEYALAFTELSEGNTSEATKHLESVLNADPNHPDANYEYGKLQLASGNVAESIIHLEIAEKVSPTQPFVHYQLQLAYRKAGRMQDAKRELQLYNAQKGIGDDKSHGVGKDLP